MEIGMLCRMRNADIKPWVPLLEDDNWDLHSNAFRPDTNTLAVKNKIGSFSTSGTMVQ